MTRKRDKRFLISTTLASICGVVTAAVLIVLLGKTLALIIILVGVLVVIPVLAWRTKWEK